MPGYYVVVAGREVVARASDGGRVTGSVAIPVPAGTPLSEVVGEPFGSADGRHFVVGVSRGGDLPGVADVTLFGLAVSPEAGPADWKVRKPVTELVTTTPVSARPSTTVSDRRSALICRNRSQ